MALESVKPMVMMMGIISLLLGLSCMIGKGVIETQAESETQKKNVEIINSVSQISILFLIFCIFMTTYMQVA